MWIQLLCFSAYITLCRGDGIAEIENFLTKYVENQNYNMCDHPSGDVARCVKKSFCDLEVKSVPVVDPTTNFIFRDSEKGTCTFLQTCCPENKILTTQKPPKAVKPADCGYSNPGGSVLREIADKYSYADYGDFPWVVALLKTKDRTKINFNTDYIGGGSLIHPSVVITVAHKVDEIDKNELVCRAGEWDSMTDQETYKHQERVVNSIIIHNEYTRKHAHNDVALLVLKEPFELSGAPHIGVACLQRMPPPPAADCFGTGWGIDFAKSDKYANIMKKLKLPLVDSNRCQNIFRNSQLGRTYNLHKSLMCAGGEEGVDTCIGDGGSPLMCPIEDSNGIRYSVVGMVVYGLECGAANLPGVYVKMTQVYDWVIREMAQLDFKLTFVY